MHTGLQEECFIKGALNLAMGWQDRPHFYSFSCSYCPLKWGTLPADLLQGRPFHIQGLDER